MSEKTIPYKIYLEEEEMPKLDLGSWKAGRALTHNSMYTQFPT